MRRRTKILATLGPATDPRPKVKKGEPAPKVEDYDYTVMDELIVRGVLLDRLSARGYGEGRPVASNETEAGRALNRRIEFSALEQVD